MASASAPVLLVTATTEPLPPDNLLSRSAKRAHVPLEVVQASSASLGNGTRHRVYADTLLPYVQRGCATIVLLVDARYTFVRCGAAELRRRVQAFGKAAVVVSAELKYSMQPPKARATFDAMAERLGNGSRYRYINAGGIAGRARRVLNFTAGIEAYKVPSKQIAGWARGGAWQRDMAVVSMHVRNPASRARLDTGRASSTWPAGLTGATAAPGYA